VITLAVFVPFAMFYMGQPLKWDYLWAGLCCSGPCTSSPLAMHLHILEHLRHLHGRPRRRSRARAGHRVTGCDAQVYPPMSDQLRTIGIELHEGYDAEQLDEFKADLYVVGNAMTRGFPVVEAILDRGLPYYSGPQWLSEHLLVDKWVLAVAGTHGKSTTSSMIAWILEDAGMDPGFLIGGVARNFGMTAARHRVLLLRDRGRRVRHRLLRQALQVRLVPAAHRGAREPRARPRRHLPGPGRHRDAVPPPRAHRAAQGLLVVNGTQASLERVLARGTWTPVERFGAGQRWSVGALHATIPST
jgi:UDP-N-acetylmuramate: L-alanyl-gamma-D-glutamyl-meso-diaminopimelate ligase